MSTRLDPQNSQAYVDLIDKYDTWLFDCDGVLWRGDTVIEGIKEVLALLRKKNKHILFVTNNATKSRANYKKKFDKLGIQAEVDEVFGSAYATAVYVSTIMKLPKDKKVFVVGMKGLEEELAEEGISFIGGTDTSYNTLVPPEEKIEPDPRVAAVVVGLDMAINYYKLSVAFRYLHSNAATAFIATNADSTYPSDKGLLPGAGAVWSPLTTALGPSRPPTVIGKPNVHMMDAIKAKHHIDPARSIMVGDRLNTDIAFGQAGGLATLLVLTGIISEADLVGSAITPDYVTPSLGDLRAAIEQ
ncbi:unnamed protein product [Peniophora sp. CBMAI 1063]|nr:unnamed protein product [Peniophora sp. CBMAI 1063]